jgi:hypothetical protein
MAWSAEQILALAPDASAARAGRDLAAPRKWRTAHANDSAVWGECQGSAAEPYRCAIDLNGPAFRCSCPSRKVPCKHALGLFVRFVNDPSALPEATPPDWVTEWLTSRRGRAERAAEPRSPQDAERAAAEQRKRAERREQRITDGIEELERWLHDLVRGGLAELPSRSRGSFDQMAARLVDAQAPGLARQVRELAYLPHSGARWPERMLIALGRLQLVLDGWRRVEAFEVDLQAELRNQVGIAESRENILAGPPIHDTWNVLGRRVFVDERFSVQRTWLWGGRTRRWALLLDFAPGSDPFPPRAAPGSCVEADLFFYPGTFPLRALLGDQAHPPSSTARIEAVSGQEALRQWAAALARNPWLERLPIALRGGMPRAQRDTWSITDAEHTRLPLSGHHGWRLMAISGGHPIDVIGEWNGFSLWPLSAVANGALVALPAGEE